MFPNVLETFLYVYYYSFTAMLDILSRQTNRFIIRNTG